MWIVKSWCWLWNPDVDCEILMLNLKSWCWIWNLDVDWEILRYLTEQTCRPRQNIWICFYRPKWCTFSVLQWMRVSPTVFMCRILGWPYSYRQNYGTRVPEAGYEVQYLNRTSAKNIKAFQPTKILIHGFGSNGFNNDGFPLNVKKGDIGSLYLPFLVVTIVMIEVCCRSSISIQPNLPSTQRHCRGLG